LPAAGAELRLRGEGRAGVLGGDAHERHDGNDIHYALSLAAFQMDYMLCRDGTAVAHVIFGNRASEKLLLAFGAKHSPGSMTWRTLRWPRWKRKKLKG